MMKVGFMNNFLIPENKKAVVLDHMYRDVIDGFDNGWKNAKNSLARIFYEFIADALYDKKWKYVFIVTNDEIYMQKTFYHAMGS